MKNALIKLRAKPKKPKREKVVAQTALGNGETLQDVINYFGDVPVGEIEIVEEWEHWDDNSTVYARHSRQQNDEEYDKLLVRYQERKDRYDAWYRENEELIETEVQRRKDLASAKLRKHLKREQDRLNSELAKLNKKLEKRVKRVRGA